ncbi:MAG: hypothetical protein R3B89_14340 [Polyangiaceae bacterium]
MNDSTHSPEIPPFQRVRVAALPADHVRRLAEHARTLGISRSAMNSDTLGCAAIFGLGGAIAVLVSVNKLAHRGLGLGPSLGIVCGLLGCAIAAGLVIAWRKSPLPEFESTTLAYHLVSRGTGELEAYCLALCTGVTFTNLYTNGLYVCTRMRTMFGDRVLDLDEVIESAGRTAPWSNSRVFRLRLDMIRAAMGALHSGRWEDVPGSELLPGRPSPLTRARLEDLSVGVEEGGTAKQTSATHN